MTKRSPDGEAATEDASWGRVWDFVGVEKDAGRVGEVKKWTDLEAAMERIVGSEVDGALGLEFELEKEKESPLLPAEALNSHDPIGPAVVNVPIGAAGVRRSHQRTARSSHAVMRMLESRADQRIDLMVLA